MKPNWKKYDEILEDIQVEIGGKISPAKILTITYRARIEVVVDFDGMLGKKGFEYKITNTTPNWTEIDGIGKFGLKPDEYKYIDDGVY